MSEARTLYNLHAHGNTIVPRATDFSADVMRYYRMCGTVQAKYRRNRNVYTFEDGSKIITDFNTDEVQVIDA